MMLSVPSWGPSCIPFLAALPYGALKHLTQPPLRLSLRCSRSQQQLGNKERSVQAELSPNAISLTDLPLG